MNLGIFHNWRAIFFVATLVLPSLVTAEFLPPAHEVFKPLRADPRELQYSLRLTTPVSKRLLGEAAMGDYLGFYRWTLGGDRVLQLNAGGGAFGRFDISGTSNDMQVVDFYGNVPLDFRSGIWSSRFMLYHTSSHLGDDFLKTHGGVTDKHSWDNLRWLVSVEPQSSWRMYAGYTYVFRTLPTGIKRSALQSGIEWQSAWHAHDHLQYYWASDIQWWQRSAWNPMLTSQLGITVAENRQNPRAISIFLEFATGRQPQGQFYLKQETKWSLGVSFRLS